MIWSRRDKRAWRGRNERPREREKKREGQKAKHGQLAVGNEGDSRYSRSGKRDRYHDARWQVDGKRRVEYEIGHLYRRHPTRKLNQKERNEEPAPDRLRRFRRDARGSCATTVEVFYRELKWAFNQCPFLTTSHEINDRKWRSDKKIAYSSSRLDVSFENCLAFSASVCVSLSYVNPYQNWCPLCWHFIRY